MTLLELQRTMLEDVRRPLDTDWDARRVAEDGTDMESRAATYIRPNDRLTSFERLELYNRQYWLRTYEAVAEDFPALRAVVGDARFERLVLGYLRERPSRSWTLRDLSSDVPAFVERHPEIAGRRHALAVDVARLELAWIDAFDATAHEPLTEDDIATLNGESVLELQPHIQLLAVGYPVDELVLAVRAQTGESDIVSNAVTERTQREIAKLPAMRSAKVWLAIHRYEDTVYYRRMSQDSFALLDGLRQGKPLGAAIEAAFAGRRVSVKRQAETVRETFSHAASLGWFVRPRLTGDLA